MIKTGSDILFQEPSSHGSVSAGPFGSGARKTFA